MSGTSGYRLTKKELVDELRKYSGAKLSGNKAQLTAQLLEYRDSGHVEESPGAESDIALSVSEEGILLGDTLFTAASVGEVVAPERKATGVGISKSSSVRDATAPLKQGEALKFLFASRVECHEVTAQCLTTLDASCSARISKDSDPKLTEQLRPLLTLCVSVKQHAEHMITSSSHNTNVLELRDRVSEDFSITEWASAETMARLHPSIQQVIRAFQRTPGASTTKDGDSTGYELVQSCMSTKNSFDSSTNGESPSDIPGLRNEKLRIEQGITRFMQDWTNTFAEPLIGEWPFDFEPKIERPTLRKYILIALQASPLHQSISEPAEKELVEVTPAEYPTEEQKIDALVKDILNGNDFPVAKGRNDGVVRAIIKEQLYTSQTQKKRKAEPRVRT